MSWMNVSEWTRAPEITFWASDGKAVFQARYVEHPEDEVAAGADEGHFTGLTAEDDWLPVLYVWTGEEKPMELPPQMPRNEVEEVDRIVEETLKQNPDTLKN